MDSGTGCGRTTEPSTAEPPRAAQGTDGRRAVERLTGRGRALSAVGAGCGLVAAGGYAAFLLAPAFGSRLDPADAYISELELPGQPGAGFFRVCDVLSGAMVVALALVLLSRLRAGRSRTVGCAALVVLGLAGIADGTFPMACGPSVDPGCPVLGLLGQPHTVSGVSELVAAVLAMLALSRTRGGPGWSARWRRLSRDAGLLVGVLAGLEGVLSLVGRGEGAVERAFVLLIAVWLAGLARYLLRTALR